jgi:hypothetical protein
MPWPHMDAPEGERAVLREELEVAVQARQELSAEHEPEIVDAFLERVGKAIDARVDERVAQREDEDEDYDAGAIGVAIGSIALGIPVTAVAGNAAGLAGVIAAWIGIGFVNLAYRRPWR